jgi:hypothetical protein
MSLPQAIRDEVIRTWLRGHYRGRVPAFIPLPEIGEDGAETEINLPTLRSNAALLEQATEYHRREARGLLRRYRAKPSRRLARRIVEHIMYAKLARQVFNRTLSQPPLTDDPFPVN